MKASGSPPEPGAGAVRDGPGQVIVWSEGTEPFQLDGGFGTGYARWNLYIAPFSTSGAEVVAARRLLLPDQRVAYMRMANGYVSAVFFSDAAFHDYGALVVRLSDGRAWRSILPDQTYGLLTFPGDTELWGAISYGRKSEARTVLRIPYSSMELVQAAMP